MTKELMLDWTNKWNQKIYWNEDGTRAENGFRAEEFWDEFGIESWPKFKDACAYHIPGKWADDMTIFVKQVQEKLGDRVTFGQIKEKFCRLTVYFDYADKEAQARMYELIQECIDRLIIKGVHPPKQEIEND